MATLGQLASIDVECGASGSVTANTVNVRRFAVNTAKLTSYCGAESATAMTLNVDGNGLKLDQLGGVVDIEASFITALGEEHLSSWNVASEPLPTLRRGTSNSVRPTPPSCWTFMSIHLVVFSYAGSVPSSGGFSHDHCGGDSSWLRHHD